MNCSARSGGKIAASADQLQMWRRRQQYRPFTAHTVDSMMAQNQSWFSLTETTNGRRYLLTTYFQHVPQIADQVFADHMQRYVDAERRWPGRVLDLAHYHSRQGIRSGTRAQAGFSDVNYVHLSAAGAGWGAYVTEAAVDNMFPVCGVPPGTPTPAPETCGACLVPCNTGDDCRKPVGPTTPTPVTTPGWCTGNYCICNTDADCANGTCENVSVPMVAAGTPTPVPAKRCIPRGGIDLCAAGHPGVGLAGRLLAVDSVCASGTCRNEVTYPRCADDPAIKCAKDGDCPSGLCTTDAVGPMRCNSNTDCRSDGYHAGDVCSGPIGTPTPTAGATTPSPAPVDKFCRQPTPTP